MILINAVLLKGDYPPPANHSVGFLWEYSYIFNIKSVNKK